MITLFIIVYTTVTLWLLMFFTTQAYFENWSGRNFRKVVAYILIWPFMLFGFFFRKLFSNIETRRWDEISKED